MTYWCYFRGEYLFLSSLLYDTSVQDDITFSLLREETVTPLSSSQLNRWEVKREILLKRTGNSLSKSTIRKRKNEPYVYTTDLNVVKPPPYTPFSVLLESLQSGFRWPSYSHWWMKIERTTCLFKIHEKLRSEVEKLYRHNRCPDLQNETSKEVCTETPLYFVVLTLHSGNGSIVVAPIQTEVSVVSLWPGLTPVRFCPDLTFVAR